MGNLTETDTTSMMSPQQAQLPAPDTVNKTAVSTPPSNYNVFPYVDQVGRLSDYEYFNNLLLGQHWEAFNIRVNSSDYTMNYGKLRYIAVNFAGLLSRVIADMLFSEPLSPKASDKGDQDFIDRFWTANRMDEQLYESELSNSALGDAIFKLRIGKRHAEDKKNTIIVEDSTPTIYFPHLDGFNVRAEPGCIELAWTFMSGDTKYLRKEIHYIGYLENHVYEMKENKVMQEVDLSMLGIEGMTGVGNRQITGIEEYLVIHVPNWKTGNRHFGISDYYDLDKIFYAINNRITKVDNILDKHSDPILMIPQGVLDEDGKVKRSALHMIEMPEGGDDKSKPEYIVWNANLEAAFTQIDKLINVFMMTAEITPDILGMGQGLNDSGRALKFKLMRTIAKAARKKIYYDRAIKQVIYVAELLAKKWDIGVGDDDHKLVGKPERPPELNWQDGLPIDDYEEVTNEVAKIDAGLQSKKQAIMNLDGVDEKTAQEKLDEIDKENPLPEIKMGMTPGKFNTSQTDKATAPEVKTPAAKVNDNSQPGKKKK